MTPPTIKLSTTQDTQAIANGLSFTVIATDDRVLRSVHLTFSGGYIATTDTVFPAPGVVTTVTLPEHITFPSNSGAGGLIKIVGRATDAAGNFAQDSISIFLNNVQALTVTLLAPTVPALASTGKNIVVSVKAKQLGGVERVGFIVTPRAAVTDPTTPPTDSIQFTPPARQPPDTTYTDTLTVNAGFTTFTVTGFAQDAGGRRVLSNTVTVNVQTPGNDVTPPTVSFTISSRVEVNDNIDVHATDPSGISWIGFRVDTVNGSTPIKFDTVNVSAGNLTTVDSVFRLALPLTDQQLPKTVVVRGYACDLATARNCGYSQSSIVITGTAPRGAPARAAAAGGGMDTVIVVAGITRPLPFGGHIADAIYNTNRRELYLTNDQLGRVEVYSLATNSFDPTGIVNAGPTPWGIALWPRDTLGNYSNDTVVVADAGGTELSVLSASSRLLLWRQPLPNFLIEKFSLVVSSTGLHGVITVHDVSDRPQYLGTVCRVTSGGSACNADSIYAIYSTTPTQSSSAPFNGRATLRMEKLVNTTDTTRMFGHLFWELGDFGRFAAPDTLRIELLRPSFAQRKVVLTSCRLVTVDLNSFGLGDKTFVRNTGNFTHGFIGEGGNVAVQFARVFAYSAKKALITPADNCNWGSTTAPILDAGTDDQDFGMSPGVHVSDFISNTGTFVTGVSTNFNGLTNLVRATTDSIYYLDDGLRLWGTSQVGSTTPGMDMNYNHTFGQGGQCTPTCGGTGSLGTRMVFAASPDTSIRVFDTFFFNQQKRILIRDPITGPLRVSLDVSTGQQYLFGITARGLVVVTLPTITNINPQAPPVR